MKKRSLVAAIAMLVVSAIVLTSATYAWFTSTSSAKVETISATVTNANGKLQLIPEESASAQTPAAASRLYPADFDVASTLNPVSMYFPTTATDPHFSKVAYDGIGYSGIQTDEGTVPETNNEAYPVANTDFIYYGFDAQYTNDGASAVTIEITPDFDQNSSNFTYALVRFERQVSGETQVDYYLFNASGAYVPVKSLPENVISGTSYYIKDTCVSNKAYIGEGDQAYDENCMSTYAKCTLWSTVSGGKLSFTAPAAVGDTAAVATADINVWVWAEGQDANCTGTISGQSTGISFDLAVAS